MQGHTGEAKGRESKHLLDRYKFDKERKFYQKAGTAAFRCTAASAMAQQLATRAHGHKIHRYSDMRFWHLATRKLKCGSEGMQRACSKLW